MTTLVALFLALLMSVAAVRFALRVFAPGAEQRAASWLARKNPTRLDMFMAELAFWGIGRLLLLVLATLALFLLSFVFFRSVLNMF